HVRAEYVFGASAQWFWLLGILLWHIEQVAEKEGSFGFTKLTLKLSDDISSLQYEPTIQEMEFYESIELDIMSSSTPSTIAPTTFQCWEEFNLGCNIC
ncbi:Alpha/beta hydrolase related protein, partial [Prunus dulcis]